MQNKTLHFLDEVLGKKQKLAVNVRLLDGTFWPDESSRPATLALKHPGALRAMFLSGTEVGLGEAYLYDDFDIEGNIESVFGLGDYLEKLSLGGSKKTHAISDLLQLPSRGKRQVGKRGPAHLSGKSHSIQRDRQAVTYHYDVSNDFYGLWLDRRMVY